jgi:xanthine dehydrogenase accessory factor
LRAVVRAVLERGDAPAVLGIVLETSGSSYRKPGALLLRAPELRVGWLSGGCLEAELDLVANEVLRDGAARVHAIDTRGDDDLLFGSASGCRGRALVLLQPVVAATPLAQALRSLGAGSAPLRLHLADDGGGEAELGAQSWRWPATTHGEGRRWYLPLLPPPRLLVLGSGPEAAPLIAQAQALDWVVEAVEHRGRWAAHAQGADTCIDAPPERAWRSLQAERYSAALVMGHHFANDLLHLRQLARAGAPAYVGLLGPPARRDALLEALGEEAGALRSRLRAPVGLHLGGEGPAAIALAIVAELQRYFTGVAA